MTLDVMSVVDDGGGGVNVVGKLDDAFVMIAMIRVVEGVVSRRHIVGADAGFYRVIQCKSAFVYCGTINPSFNLDI